MDLSIFEKAFALRDEAEKAEFGAESLEAADLRRIAEGVDNTQPLRPPQEDVVARLMMQAGQLREEASASAQKQGPPPTDFIVALLTAASAPLDTIDESAFATDGRVVVTEVGDIPTGPPAKPPKAKRTARKKSAGPRRKKK